MSSLSIGAQPSATMSGRERNNQRTRSVSLIGMQSHHGLVAWARKPLFLSRRTLVADAQRISRQRPVSQSPPTTSAQYTGRMRCPYCHADHDRVSDSRASQDGFAIRRRRQCLACKRRYTTYEQIEETILKVVKKDGVREPFDREKMRRGLAKACWKRPISDEQIEQAIQDIEGEVYGQYDVEIDSQTLGEIVMGHLGRLDQVAYVRFASVYREFKDVRDFVQELQPMLKNPPPQ
jgi:transcriptional repressor NrdR